MAASLYRLTVQQFDRMILDGTIANADRLTRSNLALGQKIFLGWRRDAGVVLET